MTVDEKERYLNEAMEQHGNYIKRLIYSYVKDSQKTEDLVQEVFIKFFTNLDTFERRSSVKTYLYRIAVNQCKNYLNSWHYRKMEVTEIIKQWKKHDSIEAEYIRKEDNQSVSEYVNHLPVKYREVIWLYYYVELTIPEVADVLKCSANTVKTRLARGRKLAKLTIEENEYDYEY